jgi:hypothetical protein
VGYGGFGCSRTDDSGGKDMRLKPSSAILFRMIFTILSFLLVGCTVKSVTTIEADGSGTYTTILGVTDQEKSSLDSMNTDMQQFCEDMRAEAEKNSNGRSVTVSLDEQEDMTLCTVEIAFDNLEELRQIYEQQGQVTVNRLEFDNNKFVYDISLTSSPAQSNPDDPAAQLGSQLGGLLAGTIDATWEVKMPGKVETNNADRIENDVLIWQLTTATQSKNMTAESRTGGLSVPVIAALALSALCLLGVGVAAIGGFIFWRARKRKEQTQTPP